MTQLVSHGQKCTCVVIHKRSNSESHKPVSLSLCFSPFLRGEVSRWGDLHERPLKTEPYSRVGHKTCPAINCFLLSCFHGKLLSDLTTVCGCIRSYNTWFSLLFADSGQTQTISLCFYICCKMILNICSTKECKYLIKRS